jgi:hypothetical protein
VLDRLPRFGVLLAALVLLAGCATNGPKKYNDDVKTNYTETCTEGSTEKVSATEAARYCECTYNAFVANIAFSKFKDYEDYLRAHVGKEIKTEADLKAKYPDIWTLMNGCVQAGPSSPTTTAAGSTTTTTR